jgi:hypothetical protein
MQSFFRRGMTQEETLKIIAYVRTLKPWVTKDKNGCRREGTGERRVERLTSPACTRRLSPVTRLSRLYAF